MGHRQIFTSSSSSPRHTRRTSTPPPRLERVPVVSSFVSRVLSDLGKAPASRRSGAIIGGTCHTLLYCSVSPYSLFLSSLYQFCFLRMSSRAHRCPSTAGFLPPLRPVLSAEALVVCACPLTLFARFVFSSRFGEDAPRIFSCDVPRLSPDPLSKRAVEFLDVVFMSRAHADIY